MQRRRAITRRDSWSTQIERASRVKYSKLSGAMLLKGVIGVSIAMVANGALAAPSYQMPFACNESWEVKTYFEHRPKKGVDLNRADDNGDPIVASAAGTISARRDAGDTSYGKHLIIGHGNGHSTLYAHLSSFSVGVGDSVRKGQRIGYVGNSGGSLGSHLHYEQLFNGTPVSVVFNGVAVPYYARAYWKSRNSCDGGGVTGVIRTAGDPLNVRAGPGTSYAIVGQVADGTTVTISCQMPGTTVTGPYGTSSIWDRIGSSRFVSDAYVRTGSDGYVAPRCQ